ncbi:hypothetical protein predicted by Glimmer/Critica [Sorangium cellulosum So ce56]|uniref:Uncharacterized protein n=1 Tax=Sorangium cellulosum (strain So ce56) TaxID=448385 RepID=A9F4G8_SORC5|nr:hypothetical protein predicted by Glimmer/Critica [Sorangium cellulosum So ce56]
MRSEKAYITVSRCCGSWSTRQRRGSVDPCHERVSSRGFEDRQLHALGCLAHRHHGAVARKPAARDVGEECLEHLPELAAVARAWVAPRMGSSRTARSVARAALATASATTSPSWKAQSGSAASRSMDRVRSRTSRSAGRDAALHVSASSRPARRAESASAGSG